MTTHLELRKVQGHTVGIITLDNAPVNTLAATLVSSLRNHVKECNGNAEVKAIVVTGKGDFFCGGAAVDEFAKLGLEAISNLHEMVNGLDASPKPTVAAVNGMALGGGCEVTLACHYRVCGDWAKMAFPEVQLGILPGAQGTQRAPRVAPLEVALAMMVTGAHQDVKKLFKAAGAKAGGCLVDRLVEAKGKTDERNAAVLAAACELGLAKAGIAGFDAKDGTTNKGDGKAVLRPISRMTVDGAPFADGSPSILSPVMKGNAFKAIAGGLDQAGLQAANTAKGMIAPHSIIRCVKAALLGNKRDYSSFQEGVNTEMMEFGKLVISIESLSLRNLFFAERAALKVKGAASGVKPAPMRKVGIIGAGLMGGGICMCFIQKGIPCVLKDAKQEWLDAGLKTIEKNYTISVSKKRMTEDKKKQLMGLITPTIDYKDLADVDMIIEAVPEIMDLKKQVFGELAKVLRKDCMVCTNTSGLDIDEIASVYPYPEKVMGTHFFSPANVMQLLENVRTKKADAQTLVTCMQMGKMIGKKAVLAGNCDGFIGNRMMGAYGTEAKKLAEDGADLEFIDGCMFNFGMPMGPLTLSDLVGQELFWKQRKARGDMSFENKISMRPYELGDWLCEQNRFGQKTGRGMFLYDAKTRKKLGLDPEVAKKAEEIRQKKGFTKRTDITEQEVVERCMYPLINEGFRILEEDMAQRPSDIDIVYAFGYGFPAYKGGPMFYADNGIKGGLAKLHERLVFYDNEAKRKAKENPNFIYHDYFVPSKLLVECVEKKTTLAKLWAEKERSSKL